MGVAGFAEYHQLFYQATSHKQASSHKFWLRPAFIDITLY